MPELPEVEVVRRGLAGTVVGRRLAFVQVLHPRPVRRHLAGVDDFVGRLRGTRVDDVRRRGKYLWLDLDSGEALLAHLGMSGQFLVRSAAALQPAHLRVRFGLDAPGPGNGTEVWFVDQRMFGGLLVSKGGPDVPPEIAHIAPDPLEQAFDDEYFVARLRSRRTGIKRALLDQTLVSGIGNIYADEALWAARLHYARPTETLRRTEASRLLSAVREVVSAALGAGGTSFDSLYVDVDGQAGYFERSLAVYGRAGLPCPRCGAPVRREPFMNRSSFRCPRCQPRPRRARW